MQVITRVNQNVVWDGMIWTSSPALDLEGLDTRGMLPLTTLELPLSHSPVWAFPFDDPLIVQNPRCSSPYARGP